MRGSAPVPLNVAPPFWETLSRILLAHTPGVLTPEYVGLVSLAKPIRTHPLVSFESLLMFDPNVTATTSGLYGSTAPDG